MVAIVAEECCASPVGFSSVLHLHYRCIVSLVFCMELITFLLVNFFFFFSSAFIYLVIIGFS